MAERLDPLLPESDEVRLQAYIEVVNGFCADLARELVIPRDLVQRREMSEFWQLAIRAV